MKMLIGLIFSVFILVGCGQKGNLYIPESGHKLQASAENVDSLSF